MIHIKSIGRLRMLLRGPQTLKTELPQAVANEYRKPIFPAKRGPEGKTRGMFFVNKKGVSTVGAEHAFALAWENMLKSFGTTIAPPSKDDKEVCKWMTSHAASENFSPRRAYRDLWAAGEEPVEDAEIERVRRRKEITFQFAVQLGKVVKKSYPTHSDMYKVMGIVEAEDCDISDDFRVLEEWQDTGEHPEPEVIATRDGAHEFLLRESTRTTPLPQAPRRPRNNRAAVMQDASLREQIQAVADAADDRSGVSWEGQQRALDMQALVLVTRFNNGEIPSSAAQVEMRRIAQAGGGNFEMTVTSPGEFTASYTSNLRSSPEYLEATDMRGNIQMVRVR